MAFFKNRKVAAILMVVLILGSALGGAKRSLEKLRQEAEQVFYQGADGDGLGIQNDLDERAKLAYNLVTVAKRCLPEDRQEITQTLAARDALLYAKDIHEKYRANLELTEATEALYQAMEGLSADDEKFRIRLHTDLQSRNDTISHDPYNRTAEEFNRKLDAFPANLLGGLTGVKDAPLFRS